MNLKKIFFFFILIIINSCSQNTELDAFKEKNSIDSIQIYLKLSKSKEFTTKQKKDFLNKAFFSSNRKDYIRKSLDLSKIAYRYYKLKDTSNFLKINSKALELAYKSKDTFVLGDSHWSFAELYYKEKLYEKAYFHFNEAFINFDKIDMQLEAGRMLHAMSLIKGFYRDYTGSEILTIEALKRFKKSKNLKRLHNCYNHLGLIQLDINEYDKAIDYLTKAESFLKNKKLLRQYKCGNLNNIGLAYLKKSDYKKAIEYFDKALYFHNTKKQYARILANKAYTKLKLNDTINLRKDFFESFQIRDSLNNKEGIIDSYLKLADYYTYIKDTLKAIECAKKSNLIASEIKNGGEFLNSLKTLSQIDTKNSKNYLDRYIQFNDSLIDVERKAQNKFTRIEFETDEFKEETERLSQQLIYIITGSILVILLLGAIYFIRIQKNKNEKLVLEAAQQKATEEVYLLTLQQQSQLEKEKAEERNRISRELHDGVLGKLFGTRVGLGFLDISEDETTQKQHQNFLNELQDIEKEIRDVSHQLHTDFDSSEVNFAKLVKALLKEKSAIGNFTEQLLIHKNVSWDKISEIIKIAIYRIIQESLQNIIKHAKASTVHVTFTQESDTLQVFIKDNGIGFDTIKKKKGIGLKNMEARLEKLNGTINIISKKEKGTEIQIQIPIV